MKGICTYLLVCLLFTGCTAIPANMAAAQLPNNPERHISQKSRRADQNQTAAFAMKIIRLYPCPLDQITVGSMEDRSDAPVRAITAASSRVIP